MILNSGNLSTLFQGFKGNFQQGWDKAQPQWNEVAMEVSSSTSENHFAWMGELPQIREWLGDRHVHNLSVHSYTLKNRKFESTVSVGREDIEDDRYGVYAPILQEMGRNAALHPDELVFGLLADGFNQKCYDGQNFFDPDHPVLDANGNPVSVSNVQSGSGDPWFLLDNTRMIKPLIFQKRIGYELQRQDSPGDPDVFNNDRFYYGVRARVNAGFGLWQLAFASKDTLNKTNYAAARQAMRSLKADYGRPMGLEPTTLVCGPSHEEAALEILNAERDSAGATNVWKGTANLIISPFLA